MIINIITGELTVISSIRFNSALSIWNPQEKAQRRQNGGKELQTLRGRTEVS